MAHEMKTEEYNEVAKRVSNALYRELQRSPDEPLSISVLTKHLKDRMNWNDELIASLHQEMNLSSSGSIDYQDIVQYLSVHKDITQEMQQYFMNHPQQNSIPRIASYNDLSHHRTHSSYFLQRPSNQQSAPMLVPPQLYFYDQTAGIALSGTTHIGGGGTLYQNPLYHGSLAFAPSPTAATSSRLRLTSSATRRNADDGNDNDNDNDNDDSYDLKTDSASTDSSSIDDEYQSKTKTKTKKSGILDMDGWVRYHNGNRVIKKLLIANNGIAAVKCIKYVRMWCYSTFCDMNAIHFVCMATPEDISSNAEYIRMADEVVPVPGGSNNYNYANITIIVTIATQTKCDAVWPGWGHASEYPSLPRELALCNIGWIGPDADAMYASGDKIMSTLIAQYARVPTVAWSGSGIRCKYKRGDMNDVEIGFKKSCINNLQQAIECAERIGYPVMIKASEGGGGKGIRKCANKEEIGTAYNQVINEVVGSPIFLMKLAVNARHLEVQLLADHWGNVIALFGRDCSMQRRHQKIIEEGPIINVDAKLLLEMENAAIALAKQVNYVGAGTVEFLYDNDNKKYYFLELNPRLQVEHPVTELISGCNLPAAQVQIAMGIPLYCIADIRRLYNQKDINGTNQFSLSPCNRIKPIQHSIACRITAENPLNNFTPTSGLISELHFRSLPNVWGYFSLKTSSSIHDYADSQFGHIFSSGKTRDDARKSMVLALNELEIRGEIRTTIEFLSCILENEQYKMGKFHTTWLEKQISRRHTIFRVPSHLSPIKIVLLGAIANGHKLLTRMDNKLLSDLKHGRNINGAKYVDHLIICPVELIYSNIKYRILIEKTSLLSYTLRYNSWKTDVVVRNLSDNGCLVSLDGRSHVLYAEWNTADCLVLCVDGHTVVFEQEYNPSLIRASMPGKLVKILVGSGQHINKGDPFAEIEVMKMYMPLIVPESGIIDVIAQEGSILSIGQSIAKLKLDDPSQVKLPNIYDQESFPMYDKPEKQSIRIDRKLYAAKERVECMLDGYIAATDIDKEYVKENVDLMMNALRDPALCLDEFNSALEPLHGRIDDNLYKKFKEKAINYSNNLKINRFRWEKTEVFPSDSILTYIDAHKQRLQSSEINTFETTIEPLKTVCNRHKRGTHFYAVQVISDLLETFSIRENRFVDKDENIVIQQLRREAPNNLQKVATIVRSHFQLKHREKVIMELLNIVDSIFHNRMYEFISELTHVLEVMTTLTDIKYGKIHLKSREILASIDVSSESQRKMEIENMLKSHPSLLQRQAYINMKLPINSTALSRSSSTASTTDNMMNSPKNNKDKASMLNRRRNKDLFNDEGLLHAIPDLLEILPKYMLSENQNVACNAVELWIRSVFAPPFYFVDKRSMSIKWLIDESTQCSFSFSTVNPSDIKKNKQSSIRPNINKTKQAFFGFFGNLHSLKTSFKGIIDQFPPKESLPVHAIILGFSDKNVEKFNEKEFTVSMEKYFTPYRAQLISCGISFISVFVPSGTSTSAPHLFTFRYMLDFREDPMTRHIMPPLVTMLEMDRLKMGFQIQWMPTENRRIHIFEAGPRKKRLFTRNWDGMRLFARVPVAQMVKPSTMVEDIQTDYYRFGGPEFALMEATHVLESIISTNGGNKYRYNHILLACFFDADFSGNDNDDIQQLDFDDIEQLKKWKKRVFNYIYGRINHDYQLFAKQLKRLHVTHIEIRFQIRMQHKTKDFSAPFIFRAFLDEPGNGVINIHLYVEKTSSEDGSVKLIDPGYGTNLGRLHNTDAFAEHIVEHNLMAQRITAKNLGTTYVYDWPILFEKALQGIWYDYKSMQKGTDTVKLMKNTQQQSDKKQQDIPFQDNLIQFEEYILDKNNNNNNNNKRKNKLIKIERAPGQNKAAMVVWKVTMKTPEFPKGREIIIASNDIANNLGTFSILEDELYNEACQWAQNEGLPFIYLSANSGARIGLSQDIMDKFKVAWAHEHHQDIHLKMTKDAQYEPKYLYLDEETYNKLGKDSISKIVNVSKIEVNGCIRYRILDIIGKYGIGVENLSGSGLIAGATSRASFNTFTLSYVTGRSVGIGAYLVRLGQRIIQKVDSPILLTGYVALNNLLGKSVYISNQQIGGAQEVMMPNGISHYQVNDDLEGAYQILKWLSYIPSRQGIPYPIEHNLLSLHDPIDRDVIYYPESDKYDPRCLIAGDIKPVIINTGSDDIKHDDIIDDDTKMIDIDKEEGGVDTDSSSLVYNEWLSGLFDRDSFTEYLGSWATSVIVGRVRLGGIPCGVIATETRTTQCIIPPDPALEDESTEISFSQPGQVWYPDSSFKTSQAIRDFKLEELPLFVLANWRGFSGGQRDMFHEILKYGSYIVDALALYKQPVFIYLPPTAELRGGAWVVLDSLINDRCIEMYSAEKSKANVLEPTATVGLKYRKKKLLSTMHRIDPQLIKLNEKLKKIEKLSPNDTNSINEIKKEIQNRERGLFPIYNKIALMYAQLHDTPQRMKDVGVIKNVVEWRNSRKYFYWRLRRKLIINQSINYILKDMYLNDDKWKIAEKELNQWILANNNNNDDDDDDNKNNDIIPPNDEIIANDKTFVEWFSNETKSFNQFRMKLQQKSIEMKLKTVINQFNGDKKELQNIFEKLISNKTNQSHLDDIINID